MSESRSTSDFPAPGDCVRISLKSGELPGRPNAYWQVHDVIQAVNVYGLLVRSRSRPIAAPWETWEDGQEALVSTFVLFYPWVNITSIEPVAPPDW
jgi:hypothetical protein